MGIQINGNTNNINAGIGSLSIEDINELDIVGVATAANFKTGVSNLHSLGLTLSGGQLDVGSNIKLGNAGVITATSFVGSGANLTSLPAQATIANNADNRVITGGSGVNLNGEANLTYDGTNLQLITDANSEGIKSISNGNSYPIFELDSDRASSGNTIGKLVSKWNNTEVASIQFVSGDDSSNKDNASIYLNTRSGGSGNVLRLRITQDGQLGTTAIVRSAYGGLDLCSQGATNYGTLTLGAGGGQNGQSRNSNQENQFRIMMPTYANPASMVTVMYGTSGSGGHDLHHGGGTGWAYATNSHSFYTTANTTTGTGTRRLRIRSNGEIQIGSIDTPSASRGALAIKASTDAQSVPINLYLQESSGGEGYGVGVDGDGDLNFYNGGATSPTLEVRDDNNVAITDGNLILASGHGIDFSASGNASGMTSELLDDYEEGSFTLTAAPSSSGTLTLNSSYNTGVYTRVGNLVKIQAYLSFSGNNNATGYLQLSSLPFTVDSNQAQASGHVRAIQVVYLNGQYAYLPDGAGYYNAQLYCNEGQTWIRIYDLNDKGRRIDTISRHFSAGADVFLNFSYLAV